MKANSFYKFKTVKARLAIYGVILERTGRHYEYWNPKDCGTVGMAGNLRDAWADGLMLANDE